MVSTPTIKQQIIDKLDNLTLEQQQRVLAFAAHLTHPQGESGAQFLESTHDIHIPAEDLELMRQAIEDEGGRIDLDEWDLPA